MRSAEFGMRNDSDGTRMNTARQSRNQKIENYDKPDQSRIIF
jgi:hypothetical protein